MVEIAPSMLGADFGRMKYSAELVAPHSAYLHMDVMDGHFVPNLTMGPDLVMSLNGIAPLDVHLMVTDPTNFIEDFKDSGAEIISVHVEANDPLKALKLIKENGLKAGIAINPSTDEDSIKPFIDYAEGTPSSTMKTKSSPFRSPSPKRILSSLSLHLRFTLKVP